ncbi:DNA (cytosine-5-)-methyltransferase [Helicobacter cappadocius]|uniref:DNA (cytosine-5-)-methyltransferase n=1 Tax=Helicobacter cappadocius TaxID=3063998 RepID=A0AA90PS29_9HELI|nr:MULTISPECIES: DNA (cytosine-5-)-methyltransferase [unclassified Helicobacter]MDO7253173.1 DNA (cytosine-5-)-methyltransferase [Helicobacter sp. faydin-H75]MDP2539097.1 DNA (cytosine-5-)-methyltransferase [Helicobacter sp. faydin-H76]
MLKFIDFCSGIGGGRLGLEQNGFRCIGFSEIDKVAIQTYESLFDTKEPNLGDLTKISAEKLPDFDVMISGFPCQSFSIVGKREGLANKEKGQIIYHLGKILEIKQPRFFILENVKGIINHDKGKTLKTVLEILEKCNYNVSYEVLNSCDFSLPQKRERVYFIGIRKDFNQNFDFSKMQLKHKQNIPKIQDFLTPNEDNLFEKTLPSYETFLRYLHNKYNLNRFNLKKLLQEDFLILDTRQSDLRLYRNTTPTLRRDRQGILYVYQKKLYKLSAIEALKLQGFGTIENLKEKISPLKNTDILRQCGNAMSVNVIDTIAKQLLEQCNG